MSRWAISEDRFQLDVGRTLSRITGGPGVVSSLFLGAFKQSDMISQTSVFHGRLPQMAPEISSELPGSFLPLVRPSWT